MINICAKYHHRADELELALKQQGYKYTRRKGLTRFFSVDTQTDDRFLKTLGVLGEIVDPSGEPGKSAFEVQLLEGMQAGDVNELGPHSWGIPRVIRRKLPYSTKTPPKSWDTNFFTQRTGRGVDMYILETVGYETSLPEFQNRDGTAQRLDGSTEDFDYLGYYHANGVASCAGGANFGVSRGSDMFLCSSHDILPDANPTQMHPDSFVAAVDQILIHYNSRAHLNKPACLNFSTIGGALSPAAFQDSINSGIVWCNAAGNFGVDSSIAPPITASSHEHIINVGGIQANDTPYKRGGFSTAKGSLVTIYAPAQYVMLQRLTSDTPSILPQSGTSFASPFTCGVVACMLEGHGRLQNGEQVGFVKQKLIDNSTKDAIVVTPQSLLWDTVQAGTMNNRITYLDPFKSFEQIPGVPTL